MTDITAVERSDGTVWLHDPQCIEVTAARSFGLPLMTMGGIEKSLAEIIAEYEGDTGNPGPTIHDCLREENMTTHEMEHVLCPRCESRFYRPYGSPAMQGASHDAIVLPPALSRMDNATYICSDCGTDEAMRDFAGQPPVPPSEWPIRRDPEFGVGSHTPKPIEE